MKKLVNRFLVLIITVVVICSCQNDEVKFNDNEKILNQENIYDFVKIHVELNNKIIAIFDNETKLDKEILFKSSSENCTNENEFKIILQKSGIIKFNELSELISLQVQNSKKFQLNNPVFFKLNNLEQNKLLTKYVDEVLNETLIGLNDKTKSFNNVTLLSCASDYQKAKGRCQRDLNLHGTFAIIGCFSGPWTCAVGTLLVGAEHTNCMKDATEDYNDCLNN